VIQTLDFGLQTPDFFFATPIAAKGGGKKVYQAGFISGKDSTPYV